MKISKSIQIFIYIYLIFGALNIYAAGNYGDSCTSLPFTPDQYLNDTAYGQVRQNINGKGWQNDGNTYCDPNDNRILIAIKANPDLSVGHSTRVVIAENNSVILGAITPNNPNLGGNVFMKDIVLTAKRQQNLLCLFMPTPQGPLPLVCKNISYTPPPPSPIPDCSNVGKSCYMQENRSQSLLNFSGLAVDCLKETLDKVFFRETSCTPQDQSISLTHLTSFPIFQGYLKSTIGAALILYTMFFGFNMILNKDYANIDKIAIFVIKFLFVTYFAIGLGAITLQSGKPSQENGMLKYGLPLLTGIAPEFAQIVFNAGGSRGLCEFDTTKYPAGYQFYALWDAIDCRIGYYLGMDLLYNIDRGGILSQFSSTTNGKGNNSPIPDLGAPDSNSPDDLSKTGSLKFFTVMFGFFMAGNIIILVSGLLFSIIFLSIVLYFITHYLVCLITIYVMTYISPIFIPMMLFTRTKAYFDSWLKICLSCALQPAIIAGFIALLLTMYDSAIYKNCEFLRHDYTNNNIKFSTFELRLPDSDKTQCQNSLGYKLLQYYAGQGWEEHLLILFPIKSIVKDIVSILAELLCVLVFSIIFYYFSKSIGQFASDLTNGPNMDSVTASPTKIVDLVKQGAAFVKDAAQMTQGKPPAMEAPGGGGKRSGGPQGGDSKSTSGGDASDLLSKGGK